MRPVLNDELFLLHFNSQIPWIFFSSSTRNWYQVKILEDEAKILFLFYLGCIIKEPLDLTNKNSGYKAEGQHFVAGFVILSTQTSPA